MLSNRINATHRDNAALHPTKPLLEWRTSLFKSALNECVIVAWLCLLFFVSNAGFTWLSLQLGVSFYGYGFAGSLLITVLVGTYLLSRKLDVLEYETFMLQ